MTRVLVPVQVLEGESVPLGLMTLLGTMDVTVLGYHVVPEQTPPDQARLQYEDRATEALEDVAEEFRQAGGDAGYRLVFTHDRTKTVRRVAEEVDSRAYVVSGATGAVDRLLVPLTGDVDVDRILSFVADLVGDREIGVTLFLAPDEETAEARASLDEAAGVLAGRGIDVDAELVPGGDPFGALIEAVAGHDAVVVGERAPSLQSLLFGDEAERIAAESVGPVLVVRRDRPPT
jgi:nucleotide-binding universal stress UspA family protein